MTQISAMLNYAGQASDHLALLDKSRQIGHKRVGAPHHDVPVNDLCLVHFKCLPSIIPALDQLPSLDLLPIQIIPENLQILTIIFN
jgi:hypothetical protein